MVTKISQVCNLDIDIDADTQSGYPGVICRKCVNLVETFHNFQLTVGEGQKMIAKRVEARQRAQETQEVVQLADTEEIMIRVHSPESIGLDPLESILPDDADSNSILPDSDSDNITIKQEKITSTAPAAETSTKSSENSLTSDKGAPMTSLFSDAMSEMTTVKVEPDITSIKQEMKEHHEEQSSNAQTFENIEITPVVEDLPEEGLNGDEDTEKSNLGDKENKEDSTVNPPISDAGDDSDSSAKLPVGEEDNKVEDQKKDLAEKNQDKVDAGNEEENSFEAPHEDTEESKESHHSDNGCNNLFSDYPQLQEDDVSETVNGIDGGADDLFSDYPDISANNGDQANGEEMPEDIDWFPSEDLEDIPGVEIRSMTEAEDFEESTDVVPDPLFELEDSTVAPPNGEAAESVENADDVDDNVNGESSEAVGGERANILADQISDESDAEDVNQESSGDIGSCMEESLNEECDADNGYVAESLISEPKSMDVTEDS